MGWHSQTERDTLNDQTRRKWDEYVFGPSGRPTPRYLDTDNPDHFRKRMMEAARSLVSEELQKVRTQDLYGSALDHYENEYLKSARAEAQRPTIVPEGELRQVTKHDAGGRPYYEFYGKASSWMNDFGQGKKRLAGIRTTTGFNDFKKV
jgi:hypothetical protein